MNTVEAKIQGILNLGFDVPSVFKSVLKKESVFTHDEEILDVILLKREYFNKHDKQSKVYSNAKLLVATSQGLIFIEEGIAEKDAYHLGFKIKNIMYSKITSIELDICLLQGLLRISADAGSNEIAVEFNTAEYEEDFKAFIDVVRKMMIDNTSHKIIG